MQCARLSFQGYCSEWSTRGVAGTKKVGGQTMRYFHLSCKLKYAEELVGSRY